jgi:hypothetical protein
VGQLTLGQLQELAEIGDRGVLPELWEAREAATIVLLLKSMTAELIGR